MSTLTTRARRAEQSHHLPRHTSRADNVREPTTPKKMMMLDGIEDGLGLAAAARGARGDALRSSSPEGSPLPTPPRPRIPELLKGASVAAASSSSNSAGIIDGPGPSSRAVFNNRVQRAAPASSSTTTAATSRGRVGRYEARSNGVHNHAADDDDGDDSPGVARRAPPLTGPGAHLSSSSTASSSPSLRAQGLSSKYATVDGNSSPSTLALSLGTAPRHLGAHLGMTTKHPEPYPSARPSLASTKRGVSYEDAPRSQTTNHDVPSNMPSRSSMANLMQSRLDDIDDDEEKKYDYERFASLKGTVRGSSGPSNGIAGRRLSSRNSIGRSTPSPPNRATHNYLHGTENGYLRSSEEESQASQYAHFQEKDHVSEGNGARALKRSQDERDEGIQSRMPSTSPPADLNGSNFVTPAMTSGSRTITSKGASAAAAAAAAGSRSVARSAVKRYGRSSSVQTSKTNARKPAARRVNYYKEEEEEDAALDAGDDQPLDSPLLEESDRHFGSSADVTPDSANGVRSRAEQRASNRAQITPPPLQMSDDFDRQRARFEEPASGIKVPLGADEEDDAEEEPVASSSARENIDSLVHHRQKKSSAMHDILAAKVPAQAQQPNGIQGARRALHPLEQHPGLLAGPGRGPSDFVGKPASLRDDANGNGHVVSAATPADNLDEQDFTARIWEEVARQRTRVFPERLLAKLNKENSELKFNNLRFKKVSKAGTGGFSTVHAVHGPLAVAIEGAAPGSKEWVARPGEEQGFFALKVVTLKRLEEQSRAEVKQEAELLALLATKPDNERYILRYFGSKCSSNSLKILLELGDEDFSRILCDKYLTQDEIRKYFRQMLEAVHFTHEQGGMLHTDLKPANFLMCNERLKLIDFGIAQKIPLGTVHIRRDAMIGTPNYMAPETVRTAREKDSRKVYKNGKASDVWSLGCILYQMVYGHPPFDRFRGADEKLRAIVDPRTPIEYPRTRVSAEYDIASDENQDDRQQQENDRDEAGNRRGYEYEEVPSSLIACMRSALEFRPDDRATIPELLRDAWVYSGVAREEKDVLDFERERLGAEAGETIEVDRDLLRNIMRKVMGYTREGDLTEENLDERAELLFTNVRTKQARTKR